MSAVRTLEHPFSVNLLPLSSDKLNDFASAKTVRFFPDELNNVGLPPSFRLWASARLRR